MAGNAMGKCLLDLPYVIVFEIFRRLPKDKLIAISKLSVKWKDITGDTRFWKNVCIKYEPNTKLKNPIFAFEELYSEPWPVKAIDLSNTWIKFPDSLKTDRLTKVTRLNLSSVKADTGTIEAILGKYQCTELYLDFNSTDRYDHVLGVAPAAFSKQTALEVLSLQTPRYAHYDIKMENTTPPPSYFRYWLKLVLSYYCKNLKSLDLSRMVLKNFDPIFFVKFLPRRLEKLLLLVSVPCPGDFFFELLAKRCPNLRELDLCTSSVKLPSLLKFEFLETLHVFQRCNCQNIDGFVGDLYMYLSKFPALKAVYITEDLYDDFQEMNVKWLRSMLESHDVIVELTETFRWPTPPVDDNLWKVSKAV